MSYILAFFTFPSNPRRLQGPIGVYISIPTNKGVLSTLFMKTFTCSSLHSIDSSWCRWKGGINHANFMKKGLKHWLGQINLGSPLFELLMLLKRVWLYRMSYGMVSFHWYKSLNDASMPDTIKDIIEDKMFPLNLSQWESLLKHWNDLMVR